MVIPKAVVFRDVVHFLLRNRKHVRVEECRRCIDRRNTPQRFRRIQAQRHLNTHERRTSRIGPIDLTGNLAGRRRNSRNAVIVVGTRRDWAVCL